MKNPLFFSLKLRKEELILKKLVVLLGILCIGIMGCASTGKSYTFGTESGEKIRVRLDTSSGYDIIENEGQFAITDLDGEAIVNGIFITPEFYEAYAELAVEYDHVTGEKGGNTYILYQYVAETHTENNYVIDIDGTDVGLIMASMAEKWEVQDIFDLMTITVEVE